MDEEGKGMMEKEERGRGRDGGNRRWVHTQHCSLELARKISLLLGKRLDGQ
jgi:hypothetical protein